MALSACTDMPPRKKRLTRSTATDLTPSKGISESLEHTPKAPTTNLIHRLPNELLQELFFWHVWATFDSPVRLTLVCRLWNSVASSYPILWTNIYYGDRSKPRRPENEEDLLYRMEGMIYCPDQDSLSRAIKRTGYSKFELTVGWSTSSSNPWPLAVDKLDATAFSTRCRLLRFVTVNAFDTFFPWVSTTRFTVLEEFLYLPGFLSADHSPSNFFPTLVENLRRHSPLLWNLLIETGFEQPRNALFPRLKKLWTQHESIILNGLSEGDDTATFRRLEELVISEGPPYYHPCALHQTSILSIPPIPPLPCASFLPMPSLRNVSLLNVPFHRLPKELHGQLTHLTVNSIESWSWLLDGPITLPVLTYLSINGYWEDTLCLNAPKLVMLILGNRITFHDYTFEYLQRITLLPEVLYIDNTLPHGIMCRFLRRNGTNLKKLSMTHVKQNDSISRELAEALIGNKNKGEALICPLLEAIEIISPEFEFDSTRRKELPRSRLQAVIKARRGTGHLRRVRCGWYPPAKGRSERMEFASRRWWKIEWDELL